MGAKYLVHSIFRLAFSDASTSSTTLFTTSSLGHPGFFVSPYLSLHSTVRIYSIRRIEIKKILFILPLLFWFGCEDEEEVNTEITVMSFNVWSGENSQAGRNKIVEIILSGEADIIGVQEMGNGEGESIANSLGFHYHQQSGGDIQVISRFPIVRQSPFNLGVLIEINPGQNVWLFNAHLAPYPYQPYDLRDGILGMEESTVIAAAEAARGSKVNNYLADMSAALNSGIPVFFTGDFNEPSHLDWTEAAAEATERPFDLKVEYPASKKIVDAGMLDSFRAVRADEVNNQAYTWTPGRPPPNLNSNEVHDRIDLVYYKGDGVVSIASQTIGLSESNANTDIGVAGFNADHRAVVSRFEIVIPDGNSALTFSGLVHKIRAMIVR